eukprot:COSAG01_NODE_4305_length_5154_cov_19.526795_1_plen_325_part_00
MSVLAAMPLKGEAQLAREQAAAAVQREDAAARETWSRRPGTGRTPWFDADTGRKLSEEQAMAKEEARTAALRSEEDALRRRMLIGGLSVAEGDACRARLEALRVELGREQELVVVNGEQIDLAAHCASLRLTSPCSPLAARALHRTDTLTIPWTMRTVWRTVRQIRGAHGSGSCSSSSCLPARAVPRPTSSLAGRGMEASFVLRRPSRGTPSGANGCNRYSCVGHAAVWWSPLVLMRWRGSASSITVSPVSSRARTLTHEWGRHPEFTAQRPRQLPLMKVTQDPNPTVYELQECVQLLPQVNPNRKSNNPGAGSAGFTVGWRLY